MLALVTDKPPSLKKVSVHKDMSQWPKAFKRNIAQKETRCFSEQDPDRTETNLANTRKS